MPRNRDRRLAHLPALGRRGEGWVVVQVGLAAALVASALLGLGWSGGVAPVAYACGGALLALGVAMLGAGALGFGRSLTPLPAPSADQELVTTGVYRLVRHPMYGGGILFALGWTIVFATVAGLAVTIAIALFLDLKARREEEWLVERFVGYDAYRRRTPRRLIPFVH